MNAPALLAFQILRCLAWSGLVMLVLASHRGRLLERALAAATAVAGLLAVLLANPYDLMPEAVRQRQMLEIAVSNLAWGLVASALLAPLVGGGRGARQARAASRGSGTMIRVNPPATPTLDRRAPPGAPEATQNAKKVVFCGTFDA